MFLSDLPPLSGPAVSVGPQAGLWLRDLSRRLEARNWTCEIAGTDGDDTVLRLQPPAAGEDPVRTVEVVVRERGDGPYFAYKRTPHRQIASIDELDRAVRTVVLVHGNKPPPIPPVPAGLVKAAADLGGRDGVTGGAFP